jgi:tetraacyldisaccharide 4'-kinase
LREYLYRLATDKEKGLVAAVIKSFLFILSLIYSFLLKVTVFLRRQRCKALGAKVISVGNITLGGTGKTILVEYIARSLKEKGHRVAVLTRGYKRRISYIPYTQDKIRAEQFYHHMGDEPYMLSLKLGDIPIIVDADRIRGARCALKDSAIDTLILDDGFQQWHIRKDLEIVTIDAQNPFGNKRIIPRGILREPPENLSRADIFMLTKTNFNHDTATLKDFLKSLNPGAQIFESGHLPVSFFDFNQPQEPIDSGLLRGKNVVLFCGIGDPDSFIALISSLGINASACFKFPDHHHYTRLDIDKIIQAAKEKNIDTIVTTEKDMVRVFGPCSGPQAVRFLFLRIKLEIKDEDKFRNRLLGVYSR